jgi:hypothetical protein
LPVRSSSSPLQSPHQETSSKPVKVSPPMELTSHLQPAPSVPTPKKRGLMSLFGKKDASVRANYLLELEKADEEQRLQRQKDLEEQQEMVRIASNRRAYLEQARQKEASASEFVATNRGPSPTLVRGESSSPIPLSVIEEDDGSESKSASVASKARCRSHPPAIQASASIDAFTVCSAASTFPPCVVCRQNERTHIAAPCMHFSFCGSCVTDLTTCPVCERTDVMFAQVSV